MARTVLTTLGALWLFALLIHLFAPPSWASFILSYSPALLTAILVVITAFYAHEAEQANRITKERDDRQSAPAALMHFDRAFGVYWLTNVGQSSLMLVHGVAYKPMWEGLPDLGFTDDTPESQRNVRLWAVLAPGESKVVVGFDEERQETPFYMIEVRTALGGARPYWLVGAGVQYENSSSGWHRPRRNRGDPAREVLPIDIRTTKPDFYSESIAAEKAQAIRRGDYPEPYWVL